MFIIFFERTFGAEMFASPCHYSAAIERLISALVDYDMVERERESVWLLSIQRND